MLQTMRVTFTRARYFFVHRSVRRFLADCLKFRLKLEISDFRRSGQQYDWKLDVFRQYSRGSCSLFAIGSRYVCRPLFVNNVIVSFESAHVHRAVPQHREERARLHRENLFPIFRGYAAFVPDVRDGVFEISFFFAAGGNYHREKYF